MQPLNNFTPINYMQIFHAENMLHLEFNPSNRPAGFPMIILLFKIFTQLDYYIVLSIIGIVLSLAIVTLLFMILNKQTKNPILALFGILLFFTHQGIFYSTSSRVQDSLFSTLMISLFLFILTFHKNNPRLLFLSSVLVIHARVENTIILLITMSYIFFKNYKLKIIDYIIAYILIIPATIGLIQHKSFINYQPRFFLGFSNFFPKITTYYELFISLFSLLLLPFLIIGIIYLVYKKKYVLLLGFAGMISIYLFFQLYPYVDLRYFINIVPFIIIIVITGLSITISKIKNIHLKYLIYTVLLISILFYPDRVNFEKVNLDTYLQDHQRLGSDLRNNKVLLIGYSEDIFSLKHFYFNYDMYNQNQDIYSYDYIIDTSERPGEMIKRLNIRRDQLEVVEYTYFDIAYRVVK